MLLISPSPNSMRMARSTALFQPESFWMAMPQPVEANTLPLPMVTSLQPSSLPAIQFNTAASQMKASSLLQGVIEGQHVGKTLHHYSLVQNELRLQETVSLLFSYNFWKRFMEVHNYLCTLVAIIEKILRSLCRYSCLV